MTRPLRILTAMGEGLHAARWCSAMVERGFDVHCCHRLEAFSVPGATLHRLSYPIRRRTRRAIASTLRRVEDRQAIVGRIHHPEDVASQLLEYEEIIRRVRPDIFHVTLRWMWLWANLIDFEPLVVSILGDDLYDDARWDYDRHRAATALFRRAALVTSDVAHARTVLEGWNCPVDRFHEVHWGVDTTLFHPGAAPRRTWSRFPRPIVYCNRNAVPNSCLDILVRAFGRLRKKRTATLVLGGRVALEETGEELRGLIRRHRIPGVRFLESIPHADLPGCYRASDLFVSVPYTDGTSVSVLEAMACGLPIVLSDIPANRELVAGGAGAALVPVMDVDALHESMNALLSNPRRCRAMSARNKATATRYDAARHMDRMAELYRGIRER